MASTNPFDPVFLSYRHSHMDEVLALHQALNEHGIQTWHDKRDLGSRPADDAIRKALRQETSGTVFWLTPDVKDSPVIRRVEAKESIEALNRNDGFFIAPTLHHGLTYTDSHQVLGQVAPAGFLESHNAQRFDEGAPLADRVDTVAQWVLEERLRRIPVSDEALQVGLNTYQYHRPGCGEALCIDWSVAVGEGAAASEQDWNRLRDVLRTVQAALARQRSGESLSFRLQAALPAAFMAGHIFHKSTATPASCQFPGPKLFSTDVHAEASNRRLDTSQSRQSKTASRTGMVVVHNAKSTFDDILQHESSELAYAWTVSVRPNGWCVESPEDAMAIVAEAQRQLREKRDEIPVDCIDLYLETAAPVAFLLGQMSNAWPAMKVMQYHKKVSPRQYSVGPTLGVAPSDNAGTPARTRWNPLSWFRSEAR